MIIARDSFLSKYVELIDIIYLLLWVSLDPEDSSIMIGRYS